jgi:hypothetical protein
MVFTKLIMTTYVNRIADWPLMSSMAIGVYKNTDATNSKKGYWQPSLIIAPILDHINGYYVRPNKVALKYPNFKKDVDLNLHVRIFNFAIKANVKTSKEYNINLFNYMLRDTTLDWCHNYMLEFPNYIFSKLTHAFCKCHWKT